MKILHLYKDFYPVVGGIENHVRTVAEAQVAAGHQVSVLVTSQDSRTHREEWHGVRVLKAGRQLTVASTPISFAFPWLLRRERPDIAHLHFPYPWGELSQLMCGRAQRLLITYHSDIVRQRLLLRWYQPLMWHILRRADRIIATNPRYVETSPYLRRLSSKCVVIPLGVDLVRFRKPDNCYLEEIRCRFGTPLVLFVGRLRYYKGLEYLIRAFPALNATLLIVGDGPMREEWQRLAGNVGVAGRVHFLTDVPDDDLPVYYHASDLFVLPASHRSEAFGTVLLEAMACGRPVISTELGTGTSWVNRHGETGLVVPPASSTELARAITLLLADEALRRRMGMAARQRVEQEFSLDRMVERLEAVYQEVLVS